jgi:Tfp pilus assembly protein PilV
MAGTQLKYNSRVAGSSILEVIISMIIILLVFGIAMMIATNVTRSSLSVKKLSAQALLQELLLKAEQNKENDSQTFTLDNFSVEQEIKPYAGDPDLLVIRLTAYDSHHDTVARLEKVILNKNE